MAWINVNFCHSLRYAFPVILTWYASLREIFFATLAAFPLHARKPLAVLPPALVRADNQNSAMATTLAGVITRAQTSLPLA